MIKVYATPSELPVPAFSHPFADYNDACNKYEEDLKLFCKHNCGSKHRLAGKEVSFPVADGSARYIIITPTKLVHINTMDGYQYPHITRLLGRDITEAVDREQKIRKLFGQ